MPAVILFFSAKPSGTGQIDLGEEYRAIDDERSRARFREAFDLRAAPAARIEDFRRRIEEREPKVVHFGGHGGFGSSRWSAGGGGRDLLGPEGIAADIGAG